MTPRRIAAAIVAAIAMLASTLAASPPAAQASPSEYTRVYYEVKGPNQAIKVICHDRTTGGVKYLSWGDDSFQKCPLSGWIDQVVISNDCYSLRALNYNTLVKTIYPRGYDPYLGGGYYGVWVTNVC